MSSDKQPLIQPPPAYGAPPPAYPPQTYQPQAYPPPNAPPAYGGGYHAAPPPAATTNNTVIVTQPAPVHTTYRTYRSGDHYLSLSIFLTICCFFWGTWCALICTIPAIVFAINARDADARGDHEAVARNRRIALFCNIGGILSYAIIMVIIIIAVSVSVATANNGYCYSYYDYSYGYYYNYCYK